MKNSNQAGNTNTILIVVVLIIVVVLGVWWYMKSTATPVDDGALNVDVNLPSGDTTPTGTGEPITQ